MTVQAAEISAILKQEIKNFGDSEHVSEDEIHREETKIQTLTDDHVKLLNTLQENKEKELMEF